MNIAFLIGNGFDLNLGLETRYEHFYKYYCGKKSKNAVIERFKQDINNPNYDWSDLELALGEYSARFAYNQQAEFIALLDDIQDSLAEYLDAQMKQVIVPKSAVVRFDEYICNIEKYLTPADAESFNAYKDMLLDKGNTIDFIIFNYTNTLERLLTWRGNSIIASDDRTIINSIEHIHGTTKSNMILGVNDESQIANSSFAESEIILEAFKKQEMNINTETLRAERCKKIIDEADFICIFGMSLGETDNCWWQHIVHRLNTSMACAAVFSKTEEISPRRMYRTGAKKRNIKNRFFDHIMLTEEEIDSISKHIYVSLNSGLFDGIELEFKKEIVKKEEDNVFAMAQYLTDMANNNNVRKKTKGS